MDILTALHNADPARGTKRCKLQTTLDEIPVDAVGRDELIAAVGNTDFAAQRLTLTFSHLKTPISSSLISDHRAKRCCCYR